MSVKQPPTAAANRPLSPTGNWKSALNKCCRRPKSSPANNESGLALGQPRYYRVDFALALRTITDHEGLEGIFGDLPPKIFIVAEGVDGLQHLLVIGVLGRFFGVDLIGRLQTCFHDRLAERAQLHAVGDEAFESLRVAGIVSRLLFDVGIT